MPKTFFEQTCAFCYQVDCECNSFKYGLEETPAWLPTDLDAQEIDALNHGDLVIKQDESLLVQASFDFND